MTRLCCLVAFGGMALFLMVYRARAGQENANVIGQVASADGTTQNGHLLRAGGTIFEGDQVTTGASGQAVVKLSATSQVELRANTSVQFTRILKRKVVQLHSGNILMENAGKDFTLVRTTKFNISPASEEPSKLYAGLMADNTTYIEAADNDAEIVDLKTGKTYILPSGQNTFVAENAVGIPGLTPSQPAQAAGGNPQPTTPGTTQPTTAKSGSHTGLIIGIAAAGGVAGAVAALAGGHGGGGSSSPSAP